MAIIHTKTIDSYFKKDSIVRFVEKVIETENFPSLGGKRILLKPNLLMKRTPDSGVITHPAVIGSVASVLSSRGANLYLGDSPGGKNTRKTFFKILREAEYLSILEKYEIKQIFFDEEYYEVSIGGALNARLSIAKAHNNFDLIINIPKFKTHGLMGITAAVKNNFGFVVGVHKALCHLRFSSTKDFANMLVDLAEFIKPSLNIIDGIVSMDMEGPSSGRLVDTNFLAASIDAFSLDAYLLEKTSVPREYAYTVAASKKRNLVAKVRREGDEINLRNFKPPQKKSSVSVPKKFGWTRSLLTAVPRFDPSICRKCYKCYENCPSEVIELDDEEYPYLADKKNCIRCYCCVELCPYEAVKLKYPLLLRLLS